jgi:hypothetical protein
MASSREHGLGFRMKGTDERPLARRSGKHSRVATLDAFSLAIRIGAFAVPTPSVACLDADEPGGITAADPARRLPPSRTS